MPAPIQPDPTSHHARASLSEHGGLGRPPRLKKDSKMADGTRVDDPGLYNRTPAIAAMAMMTNLGALTMLLTPAVIASYASEGHFSAAQASTLTSAELAGMTAAVLLTSLILNQIDRRRWVTFGLLIAAAAHLASIFAEGYPLLLVARTIAGTGIGVVYTVAVGALAATALPDRNFGFAITANQLAATSVLAVCSWIGLNHGHGPTLSVILAFTLLTGLGIPWFPRRAPAPAAATDATDAFRTPSSIIPGLLGLLGMFMFLLGVGMVWPIVGLIAQSHGITSSVVGSALALAGIGGIGAGLLVSTLGTRFGRLFPLCIGSLGIAAAMLLLIITYDNWMLLFVAPVIMFFWIFSIPYYLGAMSGLDSTGRLAVLSSAMMPFGLAAGQMLATSIVRGSNYAPTITISAALFVAGLAAIMFGLIAGSGRKKPGP
ncbi:MAG: MFS transporter [Alphaproteobacteria bacterium]|nr:MFS transporter [Alphaproteobacteria bacterium]